MPTPKFYKIKPELTGLSGLVVEASAETDDRVHVDALINPSAVVGDRTVRFPQPLYAISISRQFLEETQDPTKEYSFKNPFIGEPLFEGNFSKGSLKVAYVKFENAITITVIDLANNRQHTLYSQNFFKRADEAFSEVEKAIAGTADTDDLIMVLKDLKEEENENG